MKDSGERGLPRLVLVDGNNVMGSRPDGWWRDRRRAMQRLVDEVAAHAARAEGEWTIVFDGRPRSLTVPPDVSLSIVYSERRGVNAADGIVELAADSPMREVLVYTSTASAPASSYSARTINRHPALHPIPN